MTLNKRYIAAALLATLLVPFQNCGSKTDLGAYTGSSLSTGKVAITSSYTPGSVTAFEPTALSVTATGTNLTYQWSKDGVDIAGETKSVLVVSSPAPTPLTASTSTSNYKVVVTDADGNTAEQALALTVARSAAQEALPTVAAKTANFTRPTCAANSNQAATLPIEVTATGTRLTYAWKVTYLGVTDNLSSTGASLTAPVIPVQNTNGAVYCKAIFYGAYTATVTDAFGRSASATITVAPNNF